MKYLLILVLLVGCHNRPPDSARWDEKIAECAPTDLWVQGRAGLWRRVYDCSDDRPILAHPVDLPAEQPREISPK